MFLADLRQFERHVDGVFYLFLQHALDVVIGRHCAMVVLRQDVLVVMIECLYGCLLAAEFGVPVDLGLEKRGTLMLGSDHRVLKKCK